MFRGRIVLIYTLVAVSGLLALVPSAFGQTQAHTVEVVGSITSVTGGTAITVNGLSIDVSRAERQVPLVVGAAVKVEGTLQPNGTVLARQVKAAEDTGVQPGEVEVVGTLRGLFGTTATMDGFIFDLSSAEIEPGLTAGALVKVHARLGLGGTWIAREIERFDPRTRAMPESHIAIPAGAECSQCHTDGRQGALPAGVFDIDDNELEITGTLDAVGTGYIVVAGQRYDTSRAEVKGALLAGALVKFELTRLAGGTLIVREIKPASFDDIWDDLDDNDDRDDDRDDDGGRDDDGDDRDDDDDRNDGRDDRDDDSDDDHDDSRDDDDRDDNHDDDDDDDD